MALVIGLIIVLFVLYFLFSAFFSVADSGESTKSVPTKSWSASKEEKILDDNLGWIEEHWETARKERDAGKLKSVPDWFFIDVYEGQLQKLKEIGLDIKGRCPTAGEVEDLIGLFKPVEEENLEILRFFKVPLKGMNRSKARYEVVKIFDDPEKITSWGSRPASPMQKEFYKFFSLKVPRGLTHEDASRYINEQDEAKADEWAVYEDIYDEINDPDFRVDYDLKKISLSLYRSAIDQLKNEGETLTELENDSDVVVDKIIEIKPDIKRE